MWWDSAQISLVESVLFSISTIIILYLIGFSLVKLVSFFGKAADPFSSLDFLQKSTLRVLFGFAFIVLFVVIFTFFGFSFSLSSLLIVIIVGFILTVAVFKGKLRVPREFRFSKYVGLIVVLVILLSIIFLSSMLVSGFYGSTNDDGADHTLMTKIVLDNPSVLMTRSGQPYANFLIRYPLGTHVLCAFIVTTLEVSIQKIVILISAVFPALIALSFYSTVKSLFGSKILSILALTISGFFTIGLFFAPISWGGLPLLLSFYLSVSGIGLIFLFSFKAKVTWLHAFLVGLIFFVASRTYPVALLMLSIWFFLVLTFKIFSRVQKFHGAISFRSLFDKKNLSLLIAFLVPVLLALPFFYAILSNNFESVQASLLNILSDWIQAIKTRISFNWLIDIPAFSLFLSEYSPLFALAPYSMFLLVGLFLPKVSQILGSIFPSKEFRGSFLLIYILMLLIMSYLTLTLYLPINFMSAFFDPERVWQYVFIPAIILSAVVLFFGFRLLYLLFKRLIQVNRVKTGLTGLRKSVRIRFLAVGLLVLMILSAGLLIIPIITEQEIVYNQVKSSFSLYQTLGKDDVSLMDWIKANVPSNESILVSSGDSGQFLATVTQSRTISISNRLGNYSQLIGILSSNSSDLHAVPFLVEYNVSYVYIGSSATTYALQIPYYRHFNATQFLASPYFTLTLEIGDAWLFQFNTTSAQDAYEAASPLPAFVDQWHPSTFINILAHEGGFTAPSAGIYYGSGVQKIQAFAYEGYKLDHWLLNGTYIVDPENPLNVDYLNWNIQPIFTEKN